MKFAAKKIGGNNSNTGATTIQTFLPIPCVEDSAKILDKKRSWKQIVEASQLIDVHVKDSFGIKAAWRNHPATRLWDDHLDALILYFNTFYRIVCIERKVAKPVKMAARYPITRIADPERGLRYVNPRPKMPEWFGRPDFHAAHRSKLLAKLPEYYSQFGWTETPGGEYVWR